jgi:hypothetical protein
MMSGGNKLPKGNIGNNDICDELVISNPSMRFDQRKKDEERK